MNRPLVEIGDKLEDVITRHRQGSPSVNWLMELRRSSGSLEETGLFPASLVRKFAAVEAEILSDGVALLQC